MPPLNLGLLLPLQEREQLAKEHFIVGAVFKFFCLKAGKEKRLILVGFKYDKTKVAFVHINTEINHNLFRIPALINEHLPLSYNHDRPYLTHDSFVNCSDLIIREYEEIYELLVNDPAIHLGELTTEDKKAVRVKVVSSKVITIATKKDFAVFL